VTGRTDLVHLPSRYHGPAERAAELTGPTGSVRAALGPTGSVRAALLVDRRSFVVGDSIVVEAVVCNQTDFTVHCTAVLQQVQHAPLVPSPTQHPILSGIPASAAWGVKAGWLIPYPDKRVGGR